MEGNALPFYFELSPEAMSMVLACGAVRLPSCGIPQKIESNPAAFERMAKKNWEKTLFHLEGESI